MAVRLDLFCEDVGHEAFARAAVERVASDAPLEVSIRIGSARAGLPRLRKELWAYMETVSLQAGTPDILVILADGNKVGAHARRQEIETIGLDEVFPINVVGVPDPCVEAWLLADPSSLSRQFDHPFTAPTSHRSDELKTRLIEFLTDAGEVVMQGGAEFADEIVGNMDLYRAGKAQPTLKQFIDDLKSAFRIASVGVEGH